MSRTNVPAAEKTTVVVAAIVATAKMKNAVTIAAKNRNAVK